MQRRIVELEKQVAASQQHGEFFTPAFSTGDTDKQRIAELETREAEVKESLDEYIESLLKRPPMYVGFMADEGGFQAVENELTLLLDYRFFFADMGDRPWNRRVRESWPENADHPHALGWRLAVLYRDDKTYDRFVEHAKRLVDALYEEHA